MSPRSLNSPFQTDKSQLLLGDGVLLNHPPGLMTPTSIQEVESWNSFGETHPFGLPRLNIKISLRIGISVALVELRIIAGNSFHPQISEWINFLASFGAIILTFLAGAELESQTLKRFWKESLVLGIIGLFATAQQQIGSVDERRI